MTAINRHRASVLLIDMQERLVPEVDSGPLVAKMAHQVIEWFVELEASITVTEHCVDKLGATVFRLPKSVNRLEKQSFSALREHSVQVVAPQEQVLVCGMEAHVCVLQTILDLLEAGKQVFVMSDLVASRDGLDKAVALDRMRGAGATIVTAEMVVFEWVREAKSEGFSRMLTLVKELRKLKTLTV
ncbi:MAG: isochorismatase family protein [Litorivicinaceae bacterium]